MRNNFIFDKTLRASEVVLDDEAFLPVLYRWTTSVSKEVERIRRLCAKRGEAARVVSCDRIVEALCDLSSGSARSVHRFRRLKPNHAERARRRAERKAAEPSTEVVSDS